MVAISVQWKELCLDTLGIVAKKNSSGKGKFYKFYFYLKSFKFM